MGRETGLLMSMRSKNAFVGKISQDLSGSNALTRTNAGAQTGTTWSAQESIPRTSRPLKIKTLFAKNVEGKKMEMKKASRVLHAKELRTNPALKSDLDEIGLLFLNNSCPTLFSIYLNYSQILKTEEYLIFVCFFKK